MTYDKATGPTNLNSYTNVFSIVALILTCIGGINWGCVGLFDLNVVYAIFGGVPLVETLIYCVVAASSVYTLIDGLRRLKRF